jgi:cell wall-associated NlpC family hydrolase
MKMTILLCPLFLFACSASDRRWVLPDSTKQIQKDTVAIAAMQPAETLSTSDTDAIIAPMAIGDTKPGELVAFAETLVGTPYAWASSDPQKGFDCSGFISYVFGHFHITVPRSSVDFTNMGRDLPVQEARRGDIILFTGTDPLESTVGHMGLVVSNGSDGLHFIHSTSGKEMAVTITPLNEQYRKRFVSVRRLF